MKPPVEQASKVQAEEQQVQEAESGESSGDDQGSDGDSSGDDRVSPQLGVPATNVTKPRSHW